MKVKTDFITNSSSTAFIIINISDRKLDLVDFVRENPQLIDEFVEQYGYEDDPQYTQSNMIESAKNNNQVFKPGKHEYIAFGDEQGTLIGKVFDYILRDGGSSKNFVWRFEEWQR